jgi:integrase
VKNSKPHVVPLSDAAIAILETLPHIKTDGGFVFAGRNDKHVTGFARAKDRIDTAVTKANKKTRTDWVFHDLRRTMASGMAPLGIPLHVVEKILNHKSGTFRGIAGIYQRYTFAEEKRTALAAWASYVETVISGKAPDNVVQISRGVR